ncbi:WD40 repeat-like protein [Amylocystis lapponica]|nr:WD40 repeat-like protein [Amylocystis lapponica]
MDATIPILLPVSTIQSDFLSIVADVRNGLIPDDSFWLSCYKVGRLPSTAGCAPRSTSTTAIVSTLRAWKEIYSVSCPSLHIAHTRLAVPTISYDDPSISESRRLRQITAFDVAPDGTQYATAHDDGSVRICPVLSSSVPSTTKAHLSTITSLRFFPSSRVLLTAGIDFSLSILSAELLSDASPPSAPLAPVRTLRGHTRAVTSTAIISRGRTLLSGGKDGTLRLWDVSSGTQIRALSAGSATYTPVLALSVGERLEGGDAAMDVDTDVDAREVDTGDKVAMCGLQDGSFEAVDLRVKRAVFRSAPLKDAGSLHTLDYAPQHGLVATGAARGLVALYDVRALGAPLTTFRRNGAAVEDVRFVALDEGAFALSKGPGPTGQGDTEVGLVIATEDGLPYVASVRPEGPAVRAELVGSDCDAVRAVRVVGGEVWTAADDGVVRRYQMR